MMKEFEVLAKNLRILRKDFGYTQTDVAKAIGITYQSYQAYELGITTPNLKNFIRLAEFYDVSLDYLIGKKDI